MRTALTLVLTDDGPAPQARWSYRYDCAPAR